MGERASNDFVETVRSAADIVEVVSEYVRLKKSGSRYRGLCPFHEEKTPSFFVEPRAQFFHCFGCDTGGDVFKFVMLYEKAGFREVLETLARRWNVPIPAYGRGDDRTRRVLELNRVAEAFFRSNLEGGPGRGARAYLGKRGIGSETAARLGLGYAPDSWQALRDHLASKRFPVEGAVAAGLVMRRKDGTGHYDRFRDRLVFPIRDISGATVAFGGRALGDAEPKYLNSPETPAYVKGSHLYGLDLAREAIRREGFAVVVEGYTDLAALLEAGLNNVVASLGTAFTPQQARLLARCTERVVVSYDGDSAGAAAAVRSLDMLLARLREVRVAPLPEGQDPDDFIREEGAEAYRGLVERAPVYLEYLVDREARTRDLRRADEQVAAVNAVLPHIARLTSAIERASWAGYLADALGIEDALVLQELKAVLRRGQREIRRRVPEAAPVREIEARLVSLMMGSPEGRERVAGSLEPADLEGTQVAGIVGAILRLAREGGRIDYPAVSSALDTDAERLVLRQIAFRDEPEGEAQELDDCVRSLRRQRLIRERRDLQRQLRTAADPTKLNALLARKQQIAKQIDALS